MAIILPLKEVESEDVRKLITQYIPELEQKTKEIKDKMTKAVGEVFADLVRLLAEELVGLFGSTTRELGFLFGAWSAYKELGSQEALSEVTPSLLNMDIMTSLLHRDYISEDKVKEELSRQGFSEERIELIINASKQILDMSSILKAYSVKRISYAEAESLLKKFGLSEDNIQIMLDSTYQYLTIDDYVRLWLRKEISDDEFEYRLSVLNIPSPEQEWIKSLAYYIPSPPDLIRMAVREAFSPEIAERFGQYEDFPEVFGEWAGKQGISEFWAKAYWASHWDLPSPTMGFEMLHRRIIDEEDLKLLLRALDVMPYWRDKMIQLSYSPLTRVDIRRMFKLGVLSSDDVYNAYLDLGYSPENADRLRQFVEVEAMEGERDLTRGELMSAFEAGMITEHEVKEELVMMKYSEEEAEILIELHKYKKEKKLREAQIKAIRTKYLKNVITLDQAIRKLTELAIPSTELDSYIELWKNEKLEISEELTLADLKKALSLGIITKEDFRERLRRKGYSDTDISILSELVRKGGE